MKYEIKKLEIHSDERGWLVETMQGENIKQVLVVAVNPGRQRGGHYHLKKTDRMFVLGEAEVFLENIDTKEQATIKTSEPQLITIHPRTFHLVKNNGDKIIYFVEARDIVYDPENPDTYTT